MEQVIVAFEDEKSAFRVKEILETSGTAGCILCRSADQVRRMVHKLRVTAVVCGFKLADQGAESLFQDLPPACTMLVMAPQERLELLREDDIFRLPTPVTRGDLVASVRLLLQVGHRLERVLRSRRTPEETEVVERAKRLLMDRNGLTEEQAHRFLQKASMDSGNRLYQTAQAVLDSAEEG